MWKKWLMAGLMALGTGAVATSLPDTDFTSPGNWEQLSRNEAEGSATGLRLDGDPGRMATVSWTDLTLKAPVQLEFRVRRLSAPEGGHNFGLALTLTDGNEILVYYNGNSMAYYIREAGEIVVHEGLGNPVPFPSGGDFSVVTLLVKPDAIEVNVDGAYQGEFECTVPGIVTLRFHAYLVDVEIASLAASAMPKIEKISETGSREPVLQIDFEDDATARDSAGKYLEPARSQALAYSDGIAGRGINLSDDSILEYRLPEALAERGSVSFWVRPEWDGKIADPENFPIYGFLSGHDEAGKERFKLFMWHYLRCDFGRLEGDDDIELRSLCRGDFHPGDWRHVAVVWQDGGISKILIDGLPYWGGKASTHRINRMAIREVTSLALGALPGSGWKGLQGTLDSFRLYSTALSDAEIYAQFREFMPWDVVNLVPTLEAESAGQVGVRIAPGGTLASPVPEAGITATPEAEVGLTLTAPDGRTVAKQNFTWAADRTGEVALEVPALPPGPYRLQAEFTSGARRICRTFPVLVDATPAAAPESTAALQPGEALWSKRLDSLDGVIAAGATRVVDSKLGSYVEGSSDKASRFAFEFTVPREMLHGEPVVLEISWPDDRPRSMGFYVYPESRIRHHRDRLEGGIQSGGEYPLTHAVQTTRYLFYPQQERNLFELRSLIEGMPPALFSFAVRSLPERLPKLAINRPAGLPARELGNLDEDQSFDILMEFDDAAERGSWARTGRIMRRLLDYFDYTGQTVMHYPMIRYDFHFYPATAGTTHGGLFPYGEGELSQVIRELGRRGKRFYGTVNFFTLPEVMLNAELVKPFSDAGILLKDRSGRTLRSFNSYYRINPIHPEGQKLALAHLRRALDAYADIEGFAGVDFWIQGIFGCFGSLDEGYDDYTVGEFSRATGIAVPEGDARARQEFLTSPALRDTWIGFRAGRIGEFYRSVRALLDEYDPELELILSCDGVPTQGSNTETTADDDGVAEWFRREYGIDFAALQTLPHTRLAPLRHATAERWHRHWGNPPNNANDYLYSPAFHAAFGAAGYAQTYYTYFESFNDSLQPEVFQSYFQNADPKPFGRYFLKEFALPLALGDVVRISGGAQPLGSAGREEEIREFARAYCALPALPFAAVADAADPVTARQLTTEQGTYWYVVNQLPFELQVRVELAGIAAPVELSDGTALTAASTHTLTLRPFELRSFLNPGASTPVVALEPEVSAAVASYYSDRLEPLQAALALLESRQVAAPAAAAALAQLETALAQGQYATADRLIFSKPLRQLLERSENLDRIAEQAEMRRHNRYAVNAGSTGFYRAQDGTLFAPDQPYSAETGMGFVGARLTTLRQPADSIPDAGLYRTEAYAMDRYCFDVADGVYTVRLYAKVGYEPAAKPGIFVFDVAIGDQTVLQDFDLFTAMGGDFSRAVVLEFKDIQVRSGQLTIDFSNDDEPTAKLCNAIEVIPQNPSEPVFEDPPFIAPEASIPEPGAANAYRILFVGNSITRHGVAESLGWRHESGMAATSEANDFAHLTAARIQAELPDRPVELFFGNVNAYLAVEDGAPDVLNFEGRKLPRPDLVVIQTGEHEGDVLSSSEVESRYEERLIQPFARLMPQTAVIAVGNWYPTDGEPYTGWVKGIVDAYATVARRHQIPFVSVEQYAVNPACRGFGEAPGVRWHPNDQGMAGYAAGIFDAWKNHYAAAVRPDQSQLQPNETK